MIWNPIPVRIGVLAAAAATLTLSAAGGGETTILGEGSSWRVRVTWERDQVLLKSGEVVHARIKIPKNGWKKAKTVEEVTAEKVAPVTMPAESPSDWAKPEFDDSAWVRRGLPVIGRARRSYSSETYYLPYWKLVLARGRFEVTDPARAGDLALSVTYKGGIVVYLNGEELTRSHMPEGKIEPLTPAKPYGRDSFIRPDGHLVNDVKELRTYKDIAAARNRRLENVKIPGAKLKRGVNILAVAAHRAPIDWSYYATRVKPYPYGAYDKRSKSQWCRADVLAVSLTAAAGAAVKPNAGKTADPSLRVWNRDTLNKLHASHRGDPCEELRPLRLAGARNGLFAGQLVAEAGAPIKGLKVEVSDLTGPGTIPKSAVEVRYGRADGVSHRGSPRGVPKDPWFESLDDDPPAEAPVRPQSGRAVQPLWVRVAVPRDAKPGAYKGRIKVSAAGAKPLETELHVSVADWTLPDARDFTTRMDFIQSPTSVALAYGVEVWSEKHWPLLERSLACLGRMADKTLYITAIRRTHFGNEHGMIRFTRGADGKLRPDLSVAEKYLDLAVKHQGKIPAVILYCWEPPDSMGHAGTGPKRIHDRDILVTVVGKGGELEKAQGPKWGTEECRAFWKRLSTAVREMLRKRDMEKSLMFGLIGDHRPTKAAVQEIGTGAPDVKWAVHSHHYCDEWQGAKIGMCIALWGVRCYPADPDRGRGYGWQNPFWLGLYPRNQMSIGSPLVDHRMQAENQLGAIPASLRRWSNAKGLHGIGRIGADFWPAAKDKRGRLSTIAGRYPETYWGQRCLNYCVPSVLGQGAKGPVPSVRSEAFRENVQECEARIFIERALTDEGKKAKLGDDLAKRCQAVLDVRIRSCLYSVGRGWTWFVSSGWAERNRELFDLAAEVQKKTGK
ncbi:MAG: glycoside hydrolase domain-containing protein [Planctomycetota bacterium]|jgi:hypothetical protein